MHARMHASELNFVDLLVAGGDEVVEFEGLVHLEIEDRAHFDDVEPLLAAGVDENRVLVAGDAPDELLALELVKDAALEVGRQLGAHLVQLQRGLLLALEEVHQKANGLLDARHSRQLLLLVAVDHHRLERLLFLLVANLRCKKKQTNYYYRFLLTNTNEYDILPSREERCTWRPFFL